MLKQLFIKNFILIDRLELNFHAGVIMLTGETGAGKSIILGAIDMALGNQRGGSEKIQPGKTEADIIVTFDITGNHQAQNFLKENGLADDDFCIIRRLISLDGKNRYYINSRPSNFSLVRELSALLATLHTQHENQLLLNTKGQTMVVDAFAQTLDILEKISGCVDAWKKNHAKREELQKNSQSIPQRLDYLQYQQQELQSADINLEEILALPAKHKALVEAAETLQHYDHALAAFSSHESTGILDTLKHLQHTIAAIEKISGETELSTLLNETILQLNELHRTIRYRSSRLHPDTDSLHHIEKRMSVLHQLARKHQVLPEELPDVLLNIDQEIQELTTSEATLLTLNTEKLMIESNYQQLTEQLTKKREKSAIALAREVTQRIQQLGMSTAQFTIQFNKRSPEIISNDGAENPEFLLQANRGHPPALLKKAASGGELARVSLALQVILAAYINIPTLILDEIDVGIDGKVAAMIAKELRELGKTHQVICITHQAHIAAAANQHFTIEKQTNHHLTKITVTERGLDERVIEIARMLGGLTITDNALEHAKEMLK